MPGLAIKSNRIVTPGGIVPGCILVRDGRIHSVVTDVPAEFSSNIIHLEDNVLMPGCIDPHVHINEPGRTAWEGFNTATKAAAAGGLTTLVDMPLNSSPVTTTVRAFEEKLLSTKNQLQVNCGFWGGLVPGNENDVQGLIDKGVLGFKAFLTHSGIDDFPNVTENDLRKVMPLIAKHGLPLLVHCELTNNESAKHQNNNRSYQAYLHSRPCEWEDSAIALMIRLCEEFNCRVHIVHLSSANSIEQIKKAKAKGLPLTVETAQHYLYFNAEDITDGQTQFKCAPPIREKANNKLLWDALKEGVIDFVATDHSPAPPELKQLQSGDFTKAWGGISSLQFAWPVLWTAAKKRNATLNDMAAWLSERPAKLAGLQNSKGKIAPGFDADLVAIDPEKKFVVKEDMIQHKHKITPYLNEELYGVVEKTWLRGQLVYDQENFTNLNQGEFIINK
jgi:allantoinase